MPLKDALIAAAPIYRRHWWTADDQAIRFFIGYDSAMMRDAGTALVHAHEAVYRATWPERHGLYIAPSGGPFGAYTIAGRSGGVITTMSSRHAGYSGLRVVEMLLAPRKLTCDRQPEQRAGGGGDRGCGEETPRVPSARAPENPTKGSGFMMNGRVGRWVGGRWFEEQPAGPVGLPRDAGPGVPRYYQ